jgi:hypothetical protein
LDQAIEARRQALDGLHFPSSTALVSKGVAESADDELEVSPEFRGMALPAMVYRALELQPIRQPATATKILEALDLHGAAPTTKSPLHSIQTALNRRKNSEMM